MLVDGWSLTDWSSSRYRPILKVMANWMNGNSPMIECCRTSAHCVAGRCRYLPPPTTSEAQRMTNGSDLASATTCVNLTNLSPAYQSLATKQHQQFRRSISKKIKEKRGPFGWIKRKGTADGVSSGRCRKRYIFIFVDVEYLCVTRRVRRRRREKLSEKHCLHPSDSLPDDRYIDIE